MVNDKLIEKKLPLLISDGSLISIDYDCCGYRLKKFKQRYPDKYNQHKNQIITELARLRQDVDQMFKKPK